MARKKEYGHTVDNDGKVKVVQTTLPRHLRNHSPDMTGTIKEGPISRLLFGRKYGKR